LRLVVIANLRPVLVLQQLAYLPACQQHVCLCQIAKCGQLIVVDVRSVLLCEQIFKNPEGLGSRENQRAILVLSQPFLVDARTEIVCLSALYL